MPAPPAKVLVIGIDAANSTLLVQWAQAGILPNIRSLMTRGVAGTTRGVEGFFVGSTWPTFYTGVTPGQHGFHYLTQLRPGTYDFYRPATDRLARDPFWRDLSQAGRRVAVLDVPLARRESSLNGVQVVEWGGHDAAYGFEATPADVSETIRARFGQYPVGASCDAVRRTSEHYGDFIDALLRGIHLKADLTRHFLREGGWDFFMQVFTESHCVGHQCWHLHDVTHPAHDASIAAATGDPLRRIYAAIDDAIGGLLADAGDAVVVVMAPHGMGYWYGAQFLLQEILFRLGVAYPTGATRVLRREPVTTAMATTRRIWRRFPAPLRDALRPLRPRLRRGRHRDGESPTIDVDRSSPCIPHRNGLAVGGIRLNVIGREPQGVLEPGAMVDAFAIRLAADLLDIVDERTGKPLVRRVLRTADLYSGDHLDRLPDLLVEWSDDVPTGSTVVGRGQAARVRASSPKIGVVEGTNRYCRTGEHRRDGFFIAAGPTIRPDRRHRDVSILDFAPTFTRMLGVDRPGYEGRPLAGLLGGAWPGD